MHRPQANGGFQTLLDSLRQCVSLRLASGEWTERGLARQAGISPSHLHNVLCGFRTMTPEVADRLLATLGLSVGELDQWRNRS